MTATSTKALGDRFRTGKLMLIIGGILGVVLLGADLAIYEWAAFHDFGETATDYAQGFALGIFMILLGILGGIAVITALVGGVMMLANRQKAT